jgi:hypothetical protein
MVKIDYRTSAIWRKSSALLKGFLTWLNEEGEPQVNKLGWRHAVVKWLRATGVASIVFGGAGIVISELFVWGVGLVYVGLLILLIDIWHESEFPLVLLLHLHQ